MSVLIFGGTTEGRLAAQAEPDAVVCVTSDYARALLPPAVDCRVGRLNGAQMLRLMEEVRPARVIDATHPFAVEVTANIQACCQQLGLPYQRIVRPSAAGAWREVVRHAQSTAEAARMLSGTRGCILLTTGSHTLAAYTAAVAPERLWARVLPTAEALALCAAAGLPPSHVIAMQGPFSADFNAALYDMLEIQTMVTKDSGPAGGLEEKVLPALARGLDVIMIDRPQEEACAEKV